MPRLVKSIICDFGDYKKPLEISDVEPALGLRLDKQLTNTSYQFTNYSYFLTISMKKDFGTPESFYRAMKNYTKFIKQNCLVEALEMHFEYYKSHDKLHAHALIDFHKDDYNNQIKQFKKWSKEYFGVTHRIKLTTYNFNIYKICVKHHIPNVEITKSYLRKDKDMMEKLNFPPISFWLKIFTSCVKHILAKKNTTDKSQSVRDIEIAQLASDINGDLTKYNSQKKDFKINI